MFISLHRPIGGESYLKDIFDKGVPRGPQAELIDWDAILIAQGAGVVGVIVGVSDGVAVAVGEAVAATGDGGVLVGSGLLTTIEAPKLAPKAWPSPFAMRQVLE